MTTHFPFIPSWGDYKLSFIYSTKIFQSYKFYEQRLQQLAKPKLKISYTILEKTPEIYDISLADTHIVEILTSGVTGTKTAADTITFAQLPKFYQFVTYVVDSAGNYAQILAVNEALKTIQVVGVWGGVMSGIFYVGAEFYISFFSRQALTQVVTQVEIEFTEV